MPFSVGAAILIVPPKVLLSKMAASRSASFSDGNWACFPARPRRMEPDLPALLSRAPCLSPRNTAPTRPAPLPPADTLLASEAPERLSRWPVPLLRGTTSPELAAGPNDSRSPKGERVTFLPSTLLVLHFFSLSLQRRASRYRSTNSLRRQPPRPF
ncbi:hypothetical protein NDU88_001328 [Pleurodeles waltl]|uniref:Uncharacterized protein n=1 Tax=Pleurodeles waltl TaxID=8319 RepID=A0AAV7WL68_PLEWA|nr:hypothetical protein NDU88_001328 [Pleurodeles waltl]